MSLFEEQSDSCDAICPYCRNRYQVESEDYSEGSREEDCDNCGKTYRISQSFIVTTTTTPDCSLNGKEHEWEEHTIRAGTYSACAVCDEIKPLRTNHEH